MTSTLVRIRLFTHEAIVHAQIASIEKLLARKVDFEVYLNVKGERSNIQFQVNPEEIQSIKKSLGYTVYTLSAEQWIVHL